MKNGKNKLGNQLVCGFSYSKNIANFKAFCWNISSSILKNLEFLKSDVFIPMVRSEVKEAIGDVCKALDGNGLTSVVGLDVVCVILFGVVLTINGGLHNGEMDFFPTSQVLG